jgi:hypothetical protein
MLAKKQNHIGKLYPAHQQQNDQDHHYHSNNAAGTITPSPTVGPGGYHANQHQNQNYQQHCA